MNNRHPLDEAPPASPLVVASVAVVQDAKLLVVSKDLAPDLFYLPGGKPEPGESLAHALRREVREELGCELVNPTPFSVVDALAALEAVPMRMSVYLASLAGVPSPGAEVAAVTWTRAQGGGTRLAPAVRNHVIPQLISAGLLPE